MSGHDQTESAVTLGRNTHNLHYGSQVVTLLLRRRLSELGFAYVDFGQYSLDTHPRQ